MRPLDFLREALVDLRSSKLRSLLTSLGIIIGVGSVTLMLSLGEGVRNSVTGAFADLGSNRITVLPATPGGGFGGGLIASTLTLEDVDAISALPDVADVAPVVRAAARLETPRGPLDLAVTGTGPAYPELSGQALEAGRTFVPGADEVVLDGTASEFLFGMDQPLGETFGLEGRTYTVVGIVENLQLFGGGFGGGGPQASPDPNRAPSNIGVFLPIDDVLALSGGETVAQIVAAATDPSVVDAAVAAIETTLEERRDGVRDFRVDSLDELLGSFNQIFDVLTGFLAAIAGISLLVGGIGIMNIMLVVVAERTREIGIAKAIGATRRDIVLQFLAEAVLISLLGGLIGLVVAWIGVTLIGQAIDIETAISPGTVALALGVSAAIGIFFGVAPAWRAARMDPIAALRHE
jgi:putative ABC transport system permease protein